MAKNILMPTWESAQNEARAELVFQDRNKDYGAYAIRKLYELRLNRAFLFSTLGFVLLILSPFLFQFLGNAADNIAKARTEVEVSLTEPPPLDATPPPPPPPPPQPVRETVRFVPPVVKENAPEEDPPPQEALVETTVSTVTQEGVKDEEIPPEPVEETGGTGEIFTVVEEMPSFPGGEAKLFEYLGKNIKYPILAKENGIQGKIYVNFVVDKDGKIKDVKIIRGGLGGGLEEEALRVVRSMPEWKPGKQNGRNVPVYFNLPINFTLK